MINPTPSDPALPTKTTALRQLAQAGSRAAMNQLLCQALAHKQVKATIREHNGDLEIQLTGRNIPEPAVCLTLIAREIQHWTLDSHPTLRITGQSVDPLSVAWEEVISLPSLLERALEFKPQQYPPPSPHPALLPTPKFPIQQMDAASWQAVGAGLLLSLLVLSSGQLSFLLSYLVILIHELGHTLTAWLFGYPAVPAFDFMFGGGVTLQGDRLLLLVWLIYLGFGAGMYFYRYNPLTQRVLLVLIAVYSFCAFTPVHNLLFVAMGHGFELIFASIFLYRALSGFGCRYSIERPLYGMVGFFIVFYDLRFAWGLIVNPVARALYQQAKGGLIDSDLIRVGRDYLQVDLGVVAAILWLLAALIPILTWIIYRHRATMLYLFSRLILVK
jgi:hypothetical protein